jgi:protein tyrosine phosphatase (PTP) superfamily phosphohydrolase (DUF442 family)
MLVRVLRTEELSCDIIIAPIVKENFKDCTCFCDFFMSSCESSHDKIAPMDFSKITEDLFIGTTPAPEDYGLLHDLGVRLVVNMRWEHRLRPDTHMEPLSFLWLRTMDSPFFPIPMRALQRGVLTALETIRAGGKVYAHCAGGRHRGVAMGAAILIAQGQTADAAMSLIKAGRPVADPGVFYIRRRILRFERQWHDSRSQRTSGQREQGV